MKKIFIAMFVVLILSVRNFCNAATIETAYFNGNEQLIYPIVNVGDVNIDRKINVAIIAEIDRFLTGVYRNAQENNYEVADIRTSYEVPCNGAGNTVILSILITESNYYKGGAHPATYRHALNFNTSTGELMDTSYLTDIGEGIPQSKLISQLEEKLKAQALREKIYLFNDALPLKNLPKDFYRDENLHVHFIFQHYEVAPYAAGIIDVDIDA